MQFPLSRILPPFGALTADARAEIWTSAPVAIPYCGGAAAKVQFFVFEEANTIPDDMIAAARRFLGLSLAARDEATPHVLQAYRDARARTGRAPEIGEDRIWERVRARSVDIARRDADELAYVTLLCDCAWETQNALQIVLQGGVRLVRVSAFDGHFTEGDTQDEPALDAWMDTPSAALPLGLARSRAS